MLWFKLLWLPLLLIAAGVWWLVTIIRAGMEED